MEDVNIPVITTREDTGAAVRKDLNSKMICTDVKVKC